MFFPMWGWVYFWRTPKEAYNREGLVSTVKYGGGSVTTWAAISWHYADPKIALSGWITATDYVVHRMVQFFFPNNDAIFQDNSSPIHTARSVQSWFEKHEDALQHLPWPAQSPDLNIIGPLWQILESRVRSRFNSPPSLKQL